MTIDSQYFPQYNEPDEEDLYQTTLESIGGAALQFWTYDGTDWTKLQTNTDFELKLGYRDPIFTDASAELLMQLTSEQFVFARKTPLVQEVFFAPQEPFDGNGFEYEMDKLTMICQEIEGHYEDCSASQEPVEPPPIPGGDCLEWGVGTATDVLTEIWNSPDEYLIQYFSTNLRNEGVIAVSGDKIYQMQNTTSTEPYYSDLHYSDNLGQSWTKCTYPFDTVWNEHTPIAGWYPQLMGFATFKFGQGTDNLYVNYFYGAQRKGTIFSTADGGQVWTIRHSMDNNSRYAPDRNDTNYGIESYSYHMGHISGDTFLIGGEFSDFSIVGYQIGNGHTGPVSTGQILGGATFIADLSDSGVASPNCYQIGQVGGWVYQHVTGITDRVWAIGPSASTGDKEQDGVSWNGSQWNGKVKGSWRAEVQNMPTNGWLLAMDTTNGPWASNGSTLVAPIPGYDAENDPNLGMFYLMTGGAIVPAPTDWSSLFTPAPGDDQLEFAGVTYLFEASRWVFWYGYRTVADAVVQVHVRVAPNNPAPGAIGPWSDEFLFTFPPNHVIATGTQRRGQMQWGYSDTQNKFVISTVAADQSVSNEVRQRTYTIDDPFVCLVPGGF